MALKQNERASRGSRGLKVASITATIRKFPAPRARSDSHFLGLAVVADCLMIPRSWWPTDGTNKSRTASVFSLISYKIIAIWNMISSYPSMDHYRDSDSQYRINTLIFSLIIVVRSSHDSLVRHRFANLWKH